MHFQKSFKSIHSLFGRGEGWGIFSNSIVVMDCYTDCENVCPVLLTI